MLKFFDTDPAKFWASKEEPEDLENNASFRYDDNYIIYAKNRASIKSTAGPVNSEQLYSIILNVLSSLLSSLCHRYQCKWQ